MQHKQFSENNALRTSCVACLAWLAIGCVSAPRDPPDAGAGAIGVDSAPPPPPPPSICYDPSVSGEASQGTSNIEACAIWNHDQQMVGAVTATRDQDALTVTFSSGLAFVGLVTGGNVQLSHSELHSFEDGCLWRATETLTGTLDPTTCVLTLSYRYAETIEVSDGRCAIPCSGAGSLSLRIAPIFL
jgi:hypothetical protein